jgi:hypothetical protein
MRVVGESVSTTFVKLGGIMKIVTHLSSAVLAAAISQAAFAQSAVVPQATAIIEPAKQENVLRAGTEVPLITREELTTKKKMLRVGQRIQMEVASSITSNGVVVIPGGTPVIGEITEVRNKGMWGKSGYIGARVVSMRLGDRTVRMSGSFDDKGVTGTAGVVAAVAFVPVVGFFTTGTSAMIPMGGAVKAFLDEDIAFRAQAPAQP